MTLYTDKRLLATGFVGGTLSRALGNMREITAQTPVYEKLAIPPARMLHFHQVHGDEILSVSSVQEAQTRQAAPLADADAWLFAPYPTGWGAAIVTADCVPLFLWSTDGRAAALAHCGWRGVVKGLAGKTAQALLKACPGVQLQAWLGPHIQACCFEVQKEVASQFPAACVKQTNGKLFVDLSAAIKDQLVQAGVPAGAIHTPYYCTCGDKAHFFSWRRDHEKNLLLSFIYKP